jgi:hypothetical protein
MADVPENQVLWNNILKRMQARYPSRNGKSSFAANREARKEYMREGGQYVPSKKDVPPKMRDLKTEAVKKKKARVAKAKRENRIG